MALVAVLLTGGVSCLVLTFVGVGPPWLERAGAVLVAGVYTGVLAWRSGGRPFLVGAGAVLVGAAAVVTDVPVLRTGAAVLLTVIAGVLGVMVTVPAVRARRAVGEVLVAMGVAAVGALAALGFGPVVQPTRFEYVSLGLALVVSLMLVYRLGAGLHGLGRRGLVLVVSGGLVLAVSLAYGELLRRYGTPGIVDTLLAAASWFREHLGGVPRPIAVLLGVPALMWGSHMRARRRQGWWVCAFGVTATVTVAHSMLTPATSVLEAALGAAYTLVLGIVIGYGLIVADRTLTAPRGARSRRAEEAAAVRPEPSRTAPLQ